METTLNIRVYILEQIFRCRAIPGNILLGNDDAALNKGCRRSCQTGMLRKVGPVSDQTKGGGLTYVSYEQAAEIMLFLQYHRAESVLAAMTGNIGMRGGNVAGGTDVVPKGYLTGTLSVKGPKNPKVHITEIYDLLLKGKSGGYPADIRRTLHNRKQRA
jgi:hypothetical protein